MGKFVISYFVLYLAFSMLSSVMSGGGGITATQLTAYISDNVTTIPADTTGFLEADTIFIQNEEILYSGKTAGSFTGCVRGYNESDPSSHNSGTAVYTRTTDVLNAAFGFNVIKTGEAYGTMGVVNIGFRFLTRGIGELASFNFAFLTGDWVYLRYFGMAIGFGLIIVFAAMALGTAFGIINK
jgi:hypothetical protein